MQQNKTNLQPFRISADAKAKTDIKADTDKNIL